MLLCIKKYMDPYNSVSAVLWVQVCTFDILLLGNSAKFTLDLKIKVAPWALQVPLLRTKKSNKGIITLAVVTDNNHQVVRLLLLNEDREKYMYIQLMYYILLTNNYSTKWVSTWERHGNQRLKPLRDKIWFLPLVMSLRLAEVIAEDKENLELMAIDWGNNYWLWFWDQWNAAMTRAVGYSTDLLFPCFPHIEVHWNPREAAPWMDIKK